MSVELVSRVLRGADGPDGEGAAWPITPTPRASVPVIRLVLLVLADRARAQRRQVNGTAHEGNLVWIGVPRIAAETGLSQGAVRFALAALREQGLIAPVGGISGGRVATTYEVFPSHPATTSRGDQAEPATTSRDEYQQPATTSRPGRDDRRTTRDDRRTTRDVRRDEPEEPEEPEPSARAATSDPVVAAALDELAEMNMRNARTPVRNPSAYRAEARRRAEAEHGDRVRELRHKFGKASGVKLAAAITDGTHVLRGEERTDRTLVEAAS